MPDQRARHGLVREFDEAVQEHAHNIYECMAPVEWDVTVWLSSNYVTGRVDVADAHRLIRAVLDILRASGESCPDPSRHEPPDTRVAAVPEST